VSLSTRQKLKSLCYNIRLASSTYRNRCIFSSKILDEEELYIIPENKWIGINISMFVRKCNGSLK
jgi:hypothetical protein